MARRLSSISLPIALLALMSVLSVAARIAWIDEPCRAPCKSASDHTLVFDEAYYVNAARVIAGVAPPLNMDYATAPLGDDPNAEHPQLAKLLMAGSIELFGDGPFAWRLTSLLLGSVAILGMFALVRAAGGGDWLALGAAALMASDNLLLVHGRIGTLDVPVLAAMLWATALYLRGRPVLAGVLAGVGCCVKLVAPYVLLVLLLFEVLGALAKRSGSDGGGGTQVWGGGRRLGAFTASTAVVFVGLLAILDRIAPPYDASSGKVIGGGPWAHIAHMLSYGASQSSPHGPQGIASYPWTWLVDYKPITYLNINPSRPTPQLYDIHPAAHFLGMMSPAIMLLALPSLALAAWAVVGAVGRARPVGALVPAGQLPALGLAWFLGTFLPFAALSAVFSRTSYIYYMVVVMPGIYMTVCFLLWQVRRYRKLIGFWGLTVLAAAIAMYPFTPFPLP